MMKALIISDNHGDQRILERVTQQWQEQVDLMIHCGDSEMAPTLPVMQRFKVAVLGNNDWGLDYPLEQTVVTAGQRIYATHGHRYQVNTTLTPLMLKGQEQGRRPGLLRPYPPAGGNGRKRDADYQPGQHQSAAGAVRPARGYLCGGGDDARLLRC